VASVRLAVLTGLGALGACSEPPAPPPQDAMDGVYANAQCPSFTISDGALRFDGGAIPGKVEQGKSGYFFATEKALRYDIGQQGCRLVIVDQGALMGAERKEFASPVIMIKLFSADRSASMYWTRTGQ
jgi:hypothetical protein